MESTRKQSGLPTSHTRLITAYPLQSAAKVTKPRGSVLYNGNLDTKAKKKALVAQPQTQRRHSLAVNLIASSTGGHSFLKNHRQQMTRDAGAMESLVDPSSLQAPAESLTSSVVRGSKAADALKALIEEQSTRGRYRQHGSSSKGLNTQSSRVKIMNSSSDQRDQGHKLLMTSRSNEASSKSSILDSRPAKMNNLHRSYQPSREDPNSRLEMRSSETVDKETIEKIHFELKSSKFCDFY